MIKKIILVFCLFLSACEEDFFSPIPNFPVFLILDLNFSDADLVSPLSSKCFIQKQKESDHLGFGGILIINGFSADGEIHLYAYDLACPVEAKKDNAVVPNDEGKAICPLCGAIYNIADGTGNPLSVSKYPLKSYTVTLQGEKRYLTLHQMFNAW